ncbi:MAG: PD-(D/E)XK nuclease family protein [Coprobacillus sp.]
MRIIDGLNYTAKLESMIEECYQNANKNKNETYIFICDQPKVVEHMFFKHTHYLFNIEIMTWNMFLQSLINEYHYTKHYVIDNVELTYHLYQILKEETFLCFNNKQPYPLIHEFIPLLKDMEINQTTYLEETFSSPKLKDFIKLYQCLKQRLNQYTHLCIESLLDNCSFESTHQKHIYIDADHHYQSKKQTIINRLSQYHEITLMYTHQQDNRLFNMPYHSLCQDSSTYADDTFLTQNLFLQTVPHYQQDMNYFTFEASTIHQEVKRVVYTIYQRVVDEGLRYQDFVIAYPDSTYVDLLINTLSSLNIPHNLPITSSCVYEFSYKKIMQALESHQTARLCDIAMELSSLELDKSYQLYLESLFEYQDTMSYLDFKEFFKATYLNHHSERLNNQDHINVCSIDKLRTSSPQHIFILGLNETVLPKVIKNTSLLLDEDIEILRNHHITTPLTSLEKLGVHHNDILKALLQPYLSMTFSYSLNTISQTTLLKSSLYNQLNKMFTLKPLPINHYLPLDDYYNLGGLIDQKHILNQNIHIYKDTKNQVDAISLETLSQLYSPTMSVSQIETYNKCPFQYFIQYGLGIYPLKDNQLQQNELGSLIHYVLSIIIDNEQDISLLVNQYIDKDESLSLKISSSWVNQYFIEQLKKDLKITIDILRKNLKISSFDVFSKEQKIEDSISSIQFKGFVDRIDMYQNYVNIIDYKSSAKDIDLNLAMQGFNIQMLVYLKMVTKQYHKDPGAVLYFNTKKRVLSASMKDGFDEDDLLKAYMYGGYVIDDESHRIISAIDPTMETKSNIINVKYVKSKDKYDGHIITTQQLDILLKEIENHIYKLYQDMMSGQISITPKGSDQSNIHASVNPCRYCPYHSVCGFDVFYNEYTLVEILDVEKKLGGQEDAI